MQTNIRLIRTNSTDPDFQKLVNELDKDLATRDGEAHDFYHQYNGIMGINHALVLYFNEKAVGCGAFKAFDQNKAEIKRMFVKPDYRRMGFSKVILTELEKWAQENNYTGLVLETGKGNPEAMSLYLKSGYHQIPNYGQYIGIDNSVCFEKKN